MLSSNKAKTILAAFILLLIACATSITWYITSEAEKARQEDQEYVRKSTLRLTYAMPSDMREALSSEEYTNEQGRVVYRFVFSEELQKTFPYLIKIYNNDPAIEGKDLDAQEIMRILTKEGPVALREQNPGLYDRVIAFCEWCGEPAELVYARSLNDTETGELVYSAGQDASGSIRNYQFASSVVNGGSHGMRFTWDTEG